MTLATKTDLLTMDFAFAGQPFVQVVSKSAVTLAGMDIADNAQPMGWSAVEASVAVTHRQVFTCT